MAEAKKEDTAGDSGELKRDSACTVEDGILEEDTAEAADGEEGTAEQDTGRAEEKEPLGRNKKFGKKKEDKRDQQIIELSDKNMRIMAEFDNFRKRTDKEKALMFEIGAKSVIEKILPIVDNFERGLGTITEEEKEGAFAQGIEKIYKQLLTSLEEVGVTPIDAVGKEFDPNFHNAVMHAEDEDMDENIVAEEFQKGYLYRENVVRHSMVKVVN